MYCIEPSSKRWYANNITRYRKERKIHSWFSIVIHSLKITSISIGREIILISYYTELRPDQIPLSVFSTEQRTDCHSAAHACFVLPAQCLACICSARAILFYSRWLAKRSNKVILPNIFASILAIIFILYSYIWAYIYISSEKTWMCDASQIYKSIITNQQCVPMEPSVEWNIWK